jgi:Flp pilus assembly protein TadG
VPEFALIAPVLFLLLFGTIQFGILLSGQLGLTNGVREATRYASTVPNATTAQVETELRTRALPKAMLAYNNDELVGSPVISYCYYTNPDHTISSPSYSIRVRVTATYDHAVFMPFVDGFDGSPGDGKLSGSVTEEMRVENPHLTSTGGLSAC